MVSVKAQMTKDRVAEVLAYVRTIGDREVLVGFPASANTRSGGEITNAALGYIHDNGSPAANIPARPFMRPGVENARAEAAAIFRDAAARELRGETGAIERSLHLVGLLVVGSIQRKITEGPFEPLRPATIRRKGSSRPLIDTGQMRQAVSHVIRDRQR